MRFALSSPAVREGHDVQDGHEHVANASARELRLAPDVERFEGADGVPMLFDARSQRYVRITPLGSKVLDVMAELDQGGRAPTEAELLGALSGGDPTRAARARSMVVPFLAQLDGQGLLVDTAGPSAGPGSTFMVRVPLVHDPGPYFAPAARLLARLPSRAPLATAVALALLSVVVLGAGLPTLAQVDAARVQWPWLLLGFVVLVVHEAAHGVLLVRHGVAPRAVGVGLLLWILPVFYVDRTHAYRVPSRGARAAISLAGPWVDLLAAAVATAVGFQAVQADRPVLAATATAIALMALSALLYNLNPLLPSDGYHALEAWTGGLNTRARAFRWAGLVLRGRPLPPELSTVRGHRTLGYVALVGGTVIYGAILVVVVVRALWLGVGALT